jgi:hypothetical protein
MVPDMTNDWSQNDSRQPLSADSAFVVHVMATEADAAEIVHFHVEIDVSSDSDAVASSPTLVVSDISPR